MVYELDDFSRVGFFVGDGERVLGVRWRAESELKLSTTL